MRPLRMRGYAATTYPRSVHLTEPVIYSTTLHHDVSGSLSIYYTLLGLLSIVFAPSETPLVGLPSESALPEGPNGELYRQQLFEYLQGAREVFTLPLDLSLISSPFQRSVLDAVSAIPFGNVMTYKEVAISIGKPGASRAVGNALGSNPLPIIIPCHRVVSSNNGLGGFMRNARGGRAIKSGLLRLEGIESFNRYASKAES